MTQERLSLRKIREVLRLKHEVGLSNRAIARACRVSNSTAGEYVKRAEQAGLAWPLPSELAPRVVATIHPSAVLRAPDADGRRAAFEMLVADLRVVATLVEQ